MILVALVLVSVLFVMKCVTGLSIAPFDKSLPALLGQKYTLVCNVKDAANITGMLQFVKEENGSMSVMGLLNQGVDKCSVVVTAIRRGYSCGCGAGTNSSVTDHKQYMLEIAQLTTHDNTDWFCQFLGGNRSSSLSLVVIEISLKLTTKYITNVFNGVYYLVCELSPAAGITTTVQFMKFVGTMSVMGSVHQNGSQCSQCDTKTAGYEAMCDSGTNNSYSHSKKYLLKIEHLAAHDETVWYCYLKSGEKSKSLVLTISEPSHYGAAIVTGVGIGITFLIVVVGVSLCFYKMRRLEESDEDKVITSEHEDDAFDHEGVNVSEENNSILSD